MEWRHVTRTFEIGSKWSLVVRPHPTLRNQVKIPRGHKTQGNALSALEMRMGFQQHVTKYFWDSTEEVTKDTKSQFPLFGKGQCSHWWVENGLPALQKNKALICCIPALAAMTDLGKDAQIWLLQAYPSSSIMPRTRWKILVSDGSE